MKKILFLLVLFFLTPNLSFGDILLNQCGNVLENGSVDKIEKDHRSEYYINFEDGKVYYTYLTSRKTNDFLNEVREDFGTKPDSRTMNEVYFITFVDEKILTAEFSKTDEYGSSLKKEIEIDFKTNRVSKYFYGLNDIG